MRTLRRVRVMGSEIAKGSLGSSSSGGPNWCLADGKKSQHRRATSFEAMAKDRLQVPHVVCRAARVLAPQEIAPMRPAPVPAPSENEIQPPGMPGLSGLLTLAVGVVVL